MANVQPAPDPNIVEMPGLYEDLQRGVDSSTLPPVPQQGPYGDPATERDQGPPQASNAPNPLAVALSGDTSGLLHSPALPAPPPQTPGFADMLASALAGGAPATGSRYNPQTGEFLPPGSYPTSNAAPPPAAAGGPANASIGPGMGSPGGASIPIAGQVSDIGAAPAEDATTAAYRALHASEVAEFQRTKSLAQQAAAAGNTEMAKAYAEAASAAYKRANDITLLSIKHNEPTGDSYQPVTLPNGQIVSFNKSTGEYGTPYGPGGPKVKEPQWVETGTDIYGNKTHGWVSPPGAVPGQSQASPGLSAAPAPVPISGPYGAPSTVTPAPAAAPLQLDVAAAIQAGRAKGLTGEALLSTLPPEISDHVRAVATGYEPMIETGVAGYKPENQLINDAVRAAYPNTSPADFAARLQAKKDVAPGGKDQQWILKMDSAIGHSTEALEAGKNIGNTGSSTANYIEDQFYPSSAPVSQHVSNFNSVASLSGPELQSIYTPSGGAEAERQGQARQMNAYMSPEEMEAVHSSRVRAAAERVVAFDKQYHDAMGAGAAPWTGLSAPTVEQLQKYANDKLPPQFQARGADGKPLAPATIDNSFTWNGVAAPHSPSLLTQARQHPLAAGMGAAGAGVALGMAPAALAGVSGSALASALAAGAGGGYLARRYLGGD